MKLKKSEQLLARAALWQARVDACKASAAVMALQEAQDEAEAERCALEVCEAKARKGLNDWSAPRIRQRMAEVRNLQRAWLKLDNMDRARALDKLFNALRVRAEGIERVQIEREVYAECSGEEAERRIEARWEEHRNNL